MKKIKFLDLKRVNEINSNEIKNAVKEVLDSGWYIMGDKCKEFEENFVKDLGSNGFAIGCNSGTDAITLSLIAGGVGTGDEVITVSHTAIPTIAAIISTGANPVFVDICAKTWLMNVENIENCITEKTKAIVCVHLYGNMVDIFAVKGILKKLEREDIIIIEDVAQAQGAFLGAKQAGTIGDFGAFSFYPSKNIGALGDGGAVFTNNYRYYQKLLMYRNYGQKDRYNAQLDKGINSRLDEIQAAVVNIKLNYLHKWNEKKSNLLDLYKDKLKSFPCEFQTITYRCKPAWHLCVISLDAKIDRNKFMENLKDNGLETLIHYPYPAHLQKAFSKYNDKKMENTEKLSKSIISLPFSYVITKEEIENICNIINKTFYEFKY